MISQRQIISRSAGPIFAMFSPSESALRADDWSVPYFPVCQGTLLWQPNNLGHAIIKKGKINTSKKYSPSSKFAERAKLVKILVLTFLLNIYPSLARVNYPASAACDELSGHEDIVTWPYRLRPALKQLHLATAWSNSESPTSSVCSHGTSPSVGLLFVRLHFYSCCSQL